MSHQRDLFDTQMQIGDQLIDQKSPMFAPDRVAYRIQNADGTMHNAGTGRDSWFTLAQARETVNRSEGQRIVESDGESILWETF